MNDVGENAIGDNTIANNQTISMSALVHCKADINDLHHGLDQIRQPSEMKEKLNDLIDTHGLEAVMFIFAATVKSRRNDGRFDSGWHEWADAYYFEGMEWRECITYACDTHSTILNHAIRMLKELEQIQMKSTELSDMEFANEYNEEELER